MEAFRDDSLPAKILWYVGILIVVIGIIGGIATGFTMKETVIGTVTTYEEPHPLRWLYGGGIALGVSATGLILVGISELIVTSLGHRHAHKAEMADLRRAVENLQKAE